MSNKAIREPYADFTYYHEEYGGAQIKPEDFARSIKYATAFVDRVTFGRIRKLSTVPDFVKDATCAAAERFDLFRKRSDQDIKSESNDGYSVSYQDAGTREGMEKDALESVKMYLSGSGLLYRGRSRKYDN